METIMSSDDAGFLDPCWSFVLNDYEEEFEWPVSLCSEPCIRYAEWKQKRTETARARRDQKTWNKNLEKVGLPRTSSGLTRSSSGTKLGRVRSFIRPLRRRNSGW